ncbi:MAG: efflux transporter outer membrane subunit [Proteobacteria bacterium]|nr:efflux transporter outer membrane subunit [Pseudomonadota bacterium]
MRRRIALGFSLLLSGCALTPDYERPELELPAAWRDPEYVGDSIANTPWWQLYSDPQLRQYIEIALEENRDLRLALERVYEFQSQLTFTRADQFPFLTGEGSASRGRQSRDIVPGAETNDQFNLAANLSFEVDIWRRFARASEGARADLLSTEADYRTVVIGLVGSVANAYFQLRDLDARLEIARRTAATRAESLRIIEARFRKGTVAEIDVNQAQVELAIAEVAIAQFERGIVQTENALRELLGRNPGEVERGLALDEQFVVPEVPAGLPAELLRRRPDVVAAEQVLAAETARIGVAEALRWPSISLTGSLGAITDELSDISPSEVKAWNLLAGFATPLFNAGQLKAQAKVQRARAEQALRGYEATLLRAFREVEDALVAVRTFREEHAARVRQVVAARNASRLSRARYNGGVVDYLEVLDSERTLFSAELEESNARRQSLDAVVGLYKALGGGWLPDEQAWEEYRWEWWGP